MTAMSLQIDIDRTAGTASLSKGGWFMQVPVADLPRWERLYRVLWARGGKSKDHSTPGPWAKHYDSDLRALSAAVAKVTS